MNKCGLLLLLLCALFACCAAARQCPTPGDYDQDMGVIVDWNRRIFESFQISRPDDGGPIANRYWSIVNIAMYDAVNSITKKHKQYLVTYPGRTANASLAAAASRAAYVTLVDIFPAVQFYIGLELQTQLNKIPDSQAKADGVAIGQYVAEQVIAARRSDNFALGFAGQAIPGAPAPPNYFWTRGTPIPYEVGVWNATAPAYATPPTTPWYPAVKTFAAPNATFFRPGPPPAVDSQTFTNDFLETYALGGQNRTNEHYYIATWWAGNWGSLINFVVEFMTFQTVTLEDAVRIFAQASVASHDALATCFEAKLLYNYWRPITAARVSTNGLNPVVDSYKNPVWAPSRVTPPNGEYPSGHSSRSSGAMGILRRWFGDKVTFRVSSWLYPGTEHIREFDSISETLREVSRSRIYSGVHWMNSCLVGEQLGDTVAEYVHENFFN